MIKYHTDSERVLCERRMNWIIKAAGLVMFAPVVFCIIQMFNGVFSIWNIFPAVLCFAVCINIYIPGSFEKFVHVITLQGSGAVEKTPQSEFDGEARDHEGDMKKHPKKYKEQEEKKGLMSLDDFYTKLKGWDILVRFVLAAGLAIGAYFSVTHYTTYEQKNNCTTVEATVMSQIDKTYFTYKEDEDGTTETEHRSCEAVLQYVFNGEVKKTTVTFNNVNKIRVITFDIYVDAEGNYLQTTAKVQGFMILGITLAVMAFMLLSSIVLKFSSIFYIMIVFFAIGPVILSLVGLTVSFAELLYFDLTTFIMVFTSIGVYFMIVQYLGRPLLIGHAIIAEDEKKPKQKKVDAQKELEDMMSVDNTKNENNESNNNK